MTIVCTNAVCEWLLTIPPMAWGFVIGGAIALISIIRLIAADIALRKELKRYRDGRRFPK